ncbi:MAG: VRR-NUC domain-containing protein [Aerococcus sp.]|nr:VRR-NUC domain-containing protein [Aerococcus sp.]
MSTIPSEAEIQARILQTINQRGHRLWRSNAGKVPTQFGTYIQLFPKGFPDTVGYRDGDGKFIAIEVKTPTGKLRPEQRAFQAFIKDQPVIYGVARSVEEAIEIVETKEWREKHASGR